MTATAEARVLQAAADIPKMIDMAEQIETDEPQTQLNAGFFNALALGYIALGDLPAARFALRRGKNYAANSTTSALEGVLRALWNGNDATAIAQLQTVTVADLPAKATAAIIARVADAFSRTYAVATVADVAQHLKQQPAAVAAALRGSPSLVVHEATGAISQKPDAGAAGLSAGAIELITSTSLMLREPIDRLDDA